MPRFDWMKKIIPKRGRGTGAAAGYEAPVEQILERVNRFKALPPGRGEPPKLLPPSRKFKALPSGPSPPLALPAGETPKLLTAGKALAKFEEREEMRDDLKKFIEIAEKLYGNEVPIEIAKKRLASIISNRFPLLGKGNTEENITSDIIEKVYSGGGSEGEGDSGQDRRRGKIRPTKAGAKKALRAHTASLFRGGAFMFIFSLILILLIFFILIPRIGFNLGLGIPLFIVYLGIFYLAWWSGAKK